MPKGHIISPTGRLHYFDLPVIQNIPLRPKQKKRLDTLIGAHYIIRFASPYGLNTARMWDQILKPVSDVEISRWQDDGGPSAQ